LPGCILKQYPLQGNNMIIFTSPFAYIGQNTYHVDQFSSYGLNFINWKFEGFSDGEFRMFVEIFVFNRGTHRTSKHASEEGQ